MDRSDKLVGLQVIHTTFGQGSVLRVKPREAPEEPLVAVRFRGDDRPERQFKLSTLWNEEYFSRAKLPDGCKRGDAAGEPHQRVQTAGARLAGSRGQREAIRKVCMERQINNLVHFTRVSNLRNILQAGLLSRQALEGRPSATQPRFNDTRRLDRLKHAVCLSISFPNYRMFYKYSGDNQRAWVVLLIDPCVLWKLDCAFFEDNAASMRVKRTPLAARKEMGALKKMFEDCGAIRREVLDIPTSFPTNPQAEVLVFEAIQPTYIEHVHFRTKSTRRDWMQQNSHVAPGKTYTASSRYFKPRQDWMAWSATQLGSDTDFLEER